MVIYDFDFNLTATQLLQADYYLKINPECAFVVGAPDLKLTFKTPLFGKI